MKPYFDSDYNAAINALIPEAEEIATKKVKRRVSPFVFIKGADGDDFRFDYWTAEFHRTMNELASDRGLRSWIR